MILFTAFWLLMWAIGEVMTIHELLTGKWASGFAQVFTGGWVCAWTVAGAYIISAWCWGLAGREVILLKEGSLDIRREAFGIGRSKEFDVAQIRELRVQPQPFDAKKSPFGRNSWFWAPGTVAFDYGASTQHFGSNLDEAEAKLLIEVIKKRANL
jgi:hypothetical protein